MYKKALTKNTKSVLEKIGASSFSKGFYLANETALVLHFGHQLSVDLDWFSEKFSYDSSFRRGLKRLENWKWIVKARDTFNGVLNGVKVSFF